MVKGAVVNAPHSLGDHAAQLSSSSSSTENPNYASTLVHTEFAWKAAVSPHLAVEQEGRPYIEQTGVCAVHLHSIGPQEQGYNSTWEHQESLPLDVKQTASM